MHKSRPIGALNILSRNRDQFTDARRRHRPRSSRAHVAVALVNARLFERSRRDAEAFETLAEIGREVASVLDLDELFARIAQLDQARDRLPHLRHPAPQRGSGELEMKLAVQYGEKVRSAARAARRRAGRLRGAAPRSRCSCPDVSQDPRYIKLVPDVRSELAIPLLLKDRCIGVVDLESPELDAFSKRDVEILTLLASQAAVAIENARLYEEVRANEERLEKEVRFAQRVQAALLPAGPPKRLKGVGARRRVRAGARARRGLSRLPGARTRTRSSSRSATCRARASRRRFTARLRPSWCAAARSGGAICPSDRVPRACCLRSTQSCTQRQLEEYYCTLCYTVFDLKRRVHDAGQLRPAVSDPLLGRRVRADRAAGRAAGIVQGLDLRRGVVRAARRRRVRASAPTACSKR